MLKNPKFWYGTPGIFSKIFLGSCSLLYGYFARKNYRKAHQYSLEKQKVIAVGGLTSGGSGKTIVTQFIVETLLKNGKKTAVLSRGYGRKSHETLRVDPDVHTYKEVGDEPLLLSKYCPVFVGKNRAESAEFAGGDFDYFVMDDGLVQRYLKPDLRILVVDGMQKIGNGYLLPLGPNRLKFDWLKNDIDAVVSFNKFSLDFTPTFSGKFQRSQVPGAVIAFCGLGYPQKFFESLGNCSVIKRIAFPDHHAYTDKEIRHLLDMKHHFSATLVTTMKDFVKIPPKYRDSVIPLPVNVVIDGFSDWLCKAIDHHTV